MLSGDLSKLDTALLFVVHYKYTCRSDERWNPLTFCFFSNHGVYYVCILIFFIIINFKVYICDNEFCKKIIYLMFNIYIHLSRKLYTICFIFSVRNNSLTLRYLDIIDFFFQSFSKHFHLDLFVNDHIFFVLRLLSYVIFIYEKIKSTVFHLNRFQFYLFL